MAGPQTIELRLPIQALNVPMDSPVREYGAATGPLIDGATLP